MKRILLTLALTLGIYGIASATTVDPNCAVTGGVSQQCVVIFSANADSTISLVFSGKKHSNISLTCQGTWSSGTVKPYLSNDNSTTFAQAGSAGVGFSCTSDCVIQVSTASGPWTNLKLSLTGAGSPSLTCTVQAE